jgi:magnesium-transporting ATPase (P-type)
MRAPVADVDVARLCALHADQRFAALGSSRSGLTSGEVAQRLRLYGANALPRTAARSWPAALVANLTHPLALLLWFGAVMAFAARAPELAVAIVAVVAMNGAFAVLQEYRAERVVEALLARAALSARVRRDDTESVVPASDLVPGDVVVLAAGDVVAADCILVQAEGVSLDMLLLTGETTPVQRTTEPDARSEDVATSSQECARNIARQRMRERRAHGVPIALPTLPVAFNSASTADRAPR